MSIRIAAALSAALLTAGCASTGDGAPAAAGADGPCNTPAHAAMDFWIGSWDVLWSDNDGNLARGTNRVHRDAYGGCVITERFDGRPGLSLQGMSVSVYDAEADTWRQTWVDNQGGYIALTGGPQPDGSFLLQTADVPGKPRYRMTWTSISEAELTWRWQRRQPGSDTWQDRWVLKYSRQ